MNKASRTPTKVRQGAVQGSPRSPVGEPKSVARQGIHIAVSSDPHPVTVTGIQPGLQVQGEGVPVADWLCSCGHHERARGRAAVIRLTSRASVGICPHTAPVEGRAAA